MSGNIVKRDSGTGTIGRVDKPWDNVFTDAINDFTLGVVAGADQIPVSNETGKIDVDYIPTTAVAEPNKIPVTDGTGKLSELIIPEFDVLTGGPASDADALHTHPSINGGGATLFVKIGTSSVIGVFVAEAGKSYLVEATSNVYLPTNDFDPGTMRLQRTIGGSGTFNKTVSSGSSSSHTDTAYIAGIDTPGAGSVTYQISFTNLSGGNTPEYTSLKIQEVTVIA